MAMPVELIVARALHAVAEESDVSANAELRKVVEAAGGDWIKIVAESAARTLLLHVAKEATISQILKALGSIGAPSCLDEITQRIAACRDAQKRESGAEAGQ